MSIHHSRYDSRVTEASTYKSFSPLPTMPSKTKTKFFMLNNNTNLTLKKLNVWDKEHITQHKENVFTLYNRLSAFYGNKKLFNEKRKLDGLNSMLQSKRNYNHLMQKGKNQIIFLILSSTREIKSKNFAITEIRFGGRKLKNLKKRLRMKNII